MRTGSSRSLSLTILALLLLAAPRPARSQVVINEVLYDPDGPDTGHEFVEILNCGHTGVLLTGWVLETGNGANPDDWTVEWIGGDLDYLEVGEIFLIGEPEVVPVPDYVAPLDLQNGPDAVRLTDGSTVVDLVGWGEPLFQEYYEGTPAPDVSGGSSLARSPDCWDDDANVSDFVASAVPTPGSRNVLAFDLSLVVRHAGRTIFGSGDPVPIDCVVRNEGSLPVAAHEPVLRLLVDAAPEPLASHTIDIALAPRDSTEVVLEWTGATDGYHAASLRLVFPADADPTDNARATSFAVGGPGGLLVVNEIMYSPADGGTEWIELVSVTGDSVRVSGWMLGDDVDAFAFAGEADDPIVVPPGGFLVVAKDTALLADVPAPVVETDGWEALSADDSVALLDRFGTPIDLVSYTDRWGGDRGVSLERVRPDMPPDDANNWGGSVAPGGSTPGRANSIHITSLPLNGKLVVSPNPFTPNGDGKDDRTVIRFDLPVSHATARLSVFDIKGRTRALLLDHAEVAGRGELIWDGTGADGEPLPTGLYVLSLEAINARAGVLATARAAVGIVR